MKLSEYRGLCWNSITGKPSNYPAATHNHDSRYYTMGQIKARPQLKVWDNRGAERQPDYYPEFNLSTFFNEKVAGVSSWHSGITVRGWNDLYQSWQLFSGSATSASKHLYFRYGVNSWSSPHKIYHSGDKPTKADVGLGNVDNYSQAHYDGRYLGKMATAARAGRLATARKIALGGDVTGSANFDGSGNISISVQVKDGSHTHPMGNISGLSQALEARAAKNHTHDRSEVGIPAVIPLWQGAAGPGTTIILPNPHFVPDFSVFIFMFFSQRTGRFFSAPFFFPSYWENTEVVLAAEGDDAAAIKYLGVGSKRFQVLCDSVFLLKHLSGVKL